LKNTVLPLLSSSLLWNLHHENNSLRSKVIPINVLKNTCPGFLPLKNTVLPRFRVTNVNILLKTLYQIKAFNIFFIMEFTP
jgi:hypothetical protein